MFPSTILQAPSDGKEKEMERGGSSQGLDLWGWLPADSYYALQFGCYFKCLKSLSNSTMILDISKVCPVRLEARHRRRHRCQSSKSQPTPPDRGAGRPPIIERSEELAAGAPEGRRKQRKRKKRNPLPSTFRRAWDDNLYIPSRSYLCAQEVDNGSGGYVGSVAFISIVLDH
ncbi:hypothetical protein B0T18DRAFT_387128 [Schizothecium vesticola]|uniref:Uncharacterized protein n=1 Tax=Schizothecium vesticola TaxID=314040 RepID=A0AA40F4M5_9PEZI|nr:hypothetical protein B0T18DRAFT_387128 [Schizothecium vesticola]